MHPTRRVKPFIIAATGSFAALFFALSSCSFPNSNKVGGFFIADKGLPRTVGPGRAQIVGYVVNVSGPGISPTVSAEGIGDYAPDCVDVGVSSLVVSYETLSEKGVRLRIPGGPNRKIEVLGVGSSLGSVVLDQPVTALFKNRVPQLYSLSKLTGVNLFKDSSIELTGPANPVNPPDILANCFSKSGSGSDGGIPLTSISALRIVAISQGFSSELSQVILDKETGLLSAGPSKISITNQIDQMVLTPDKKRAVLWSAPLAVNRTYFMGSNGVLDLTGSSGEISTFLTVKSSSAVFGSSGEYGFLGTEDEVRFIKQVGGKYVTNGDPAAISGGVQLLRFQNFVYRLFQEIGGGGIGFGVLPAGSFDNDYKFQPVATPSLTNAVIYPKSIITNKGIYVLYAQASDLKLRFFAHGGGGPPVETGDAITLGQTIYEPYVRLAATPDGKYLYVHNGSSAFSGNIKFFVLNEDGSLPLVQGLGPLTADFQDLTVDPFSRFVVLLESTAGVSRLKTYKIGTSGALSPAPNLLDSTTAPNNVAVNLRRLEVMPVF